MMIISHYSLPIIIIQFHLIDETPPVIASLHLQILGRVVESPPSWRVHCLTAADPNSICLVRFPRFVPTEILIYEMNYLVALMTLTGCRSGLRFVRLKMVLAHSCYSASSPNLYGLGFPTPLQTLNLLHFVFRCLAPFQFGPHHS